MKNKQQKNDKQHVLIRYFNAFEKTVPETEIENRWHDLMQKVEQDGKPKRYNLPLFAKIACIAALLGGLIWVTWSPADNTRERLEHAIAGLERHPVDTARQITLITYSQKQIQIDKGAVVAYSQKGEVSVDEKKIEESSEEIEYNQLIVPKGKYSRLVLSDGSSLHVNAGTKVVYPNQFEGKTREIYVEGEIYIDVKRDESKPFIVRTSEFDIRVLGTAFNVNAYKGMERAEVVLVRGSVAVKDRENKETRIQPNELLNLLDGVTAGKQTVNAEDYTAWTLGRLPLNGKKIKDILYKLSLFYGIEIDYDASLEKYPLHGIIDLSVPPEKVLERISKIVPLSYEKTTDGFYLYMKQDVEP